MPYEIERWVDNDGNNDTAEIWVLVDTVYGNNSTQSFIMYWGKAGAVDSSSFFKSAVFDTTNKFKALYHLNENPAGGASSIKDRTVNAFNGTPGGMDASNRVAGNIGYGLNFNGSSNYVNLGNVAIHNSAAYTVSAWVKGATGQSDVRIFADASTVDNDPLFTMNTAYWDGTPEPLPLSEMIAVPNVYSRPIPQLQVMYSMVHGII